MANKALLYHVLFEERLIIGLIKDCVSIVKMSPNEGFIDVN